MRYCGPYAITKKINDQAYELELQSQIKVHNVFLVNLLKKHVADSPHMIYDEHLTISKDGTLDIQFDSIL